MPVIADRRGFSRRPGAPLPAPPRPPHRGRIDAKRRQADSEEARPREQRCGRRLGQVAHEAREGPVRVNVVAARIS